MRDQTTVITDTLIPAPPAPSSPYATRVKLQPVRKLTKAHMSLGARPDAVTEGQALVEAVAQHLATQLATEVAITARFADATLHPYNHLSRQALFAVFELNGDGIAVLELEAMLVGALLQQVAGTPSAMAPPAKLTRIEEAALGSLLLSTLSTIRGAQSRYQPRLVALYVDRGEVLRSADLRRRHVAFDLAVRVGVVNGTARLLLSSLWLQSVLEQIAISYPAELADGVAAAGLAADCLIGSTVLSRDDLAALDVGDVVIFPGVSTQGEQLFGRGRLVTPSFELRGAFAADGFTLKRAFERPTPENAMSTAADPTIPVEVEIELARVRIPLHQLSALRTGAVLPLHINAAQTVTVRIGDKAVAKAELVEVEGEIGARIIALF